MSKIASRRKHQRYGCLTPARLEFEDLVLEVTLMNFCHQGMLVNSSPQIIDSINQKIKNTDHPQARLICHLNGATYELQVEIRRAYDTFFGVYVAEGLPPLLFENLGHTLPQSISIPQHDQMDSTAQSRQRLLAHDIVAACQNVMMPGIRRFFTQLPDKLMSHAEKATQAHQVQKLFALSSAIRQKTELPYNFQHILRDKIIEAITQKQAVLTFKPKTSFEELSLVETDEFDQWVAIKATAQRIENQVQEYLLPVIERLKPQYAKPEEMPMLPRGVAYLLQQQLIGQGFDQTSQRAALETFASITADSFKEFLSSLNKVLEKHGYVPRVPQNIQGIRSSIKATDGPATTRMSEEDMKKYAAPQKVKAKAHDDMHEPIPGLVPNATAFDYQSGLASATESLHKVRALLRGLNKETPEPGIPVVQEQHISFDQLGIQLDQMTESLAQSLNIKEPWQTESVIRSLYDLFANSISSGNPEDIQSQETTADAVSLLKYLQSQAQTQELKLIPSDMNAIELVDAFFDDIQANDFLIDDLKTVINQFRALTAADYLQKGRDFYLKSDVKHMIFQLQTIAYEPMVWVGRHKKSILMGIDSIYQHRQESLLNSNDPDTGLTIAIQQMGQILNAIERQIFDIRLKNKKRLIDACMTRLRTQEKRNQVQQYLSGFLTAGKLIPRWLEQLMRMGWAEYLAFLSIREDKADEFRQATEKTRMLFDVVPLITKSQTGLFADLKNQLNSIMAFIHQGLTDIHTASETLETWQDLMTDVFNGHQNKLLQMVPPSHWYIPQDDKKPASDHYLMKKLDMIEAGQWLHCPHLERDKTYIQVAWAATDRSVFLLVNHSFVSIGEYSQQAMMDLLGLPSTRLINENLLPFMPKGIENQFYRIYDKIRNGLLRDQITGFLVTADLENQINHLISQNTPFYLFALRIKELQHIESIHGAEALNQCLARIALQLTESQEKCLKQQSDYDIDHLTRAQDNLFYFAIIDVHPDNQGAFINQKLQKLLRMLLASLEESLSSVKLGSNTVKLTLTYGFIKSTDLEISAHYMLKAALQACQNQNQNFMVLDNVYVANPHDLEKEQTRQDMLTWIHQAELASLTERISIRKNRIKAIEGDEEFIHLKPEAESELINLIFKSGRGYLLDQWLIDQAAELMLQTDVQTVFVTLKSNIIEHNLFFEKLYARMASLPKHKKLHFCFDNQHLPELESLADFCREVKSYGCEVSLYNWGLDARSFEILQYNFFSQLSISETILTGEGPQKKALLKTLVALAQEIKIDLILSVPKHMNNNQIEKLLQDIKPKLLEM